MISSAGLGREDEVKEYVSKTNLEDASAGVKKGLEMLEIYSNVRKRLGA